MKLKAKQYLVFSNLVLAGLVVWLLADRMTPVEQAKPKQSKPHYSDNWKYRQYTDFYTVYSKKGNVVMLGNSITNRVDWNELFDRTDIINRGIGGDITEGFIHRLDEVLRVKPKVCFILGGINDLSQGIEGKQIVANLDTIVKSLKENDIEPIVQSILYVTKPFPKELNDRVKETNQLIIDMCKKNRVQYIDLNKGMGNKTQLLEEYSFDGIHLSGKGYYKWKSIIEASLKEKVDTP